jgi:hypothetical protein
MAECQVRIEPLSRQDWDSGSIYIPVSPPNLIISADRYRPEIPDHNLNLTQA